MVGENHRENDRPKKMCIFPYTIHVLGIFTYMWLISIYFDGKCTVGKYTIHGWSWVLDRLKCLRCTVCFLSVPFFDCVMCISDNAFFDWEWEMCLVRSGNVLEHRWCFMTSIVCCVCEYHRVSDYLTAPLLVDTIRGYTPLYYMHVFTYLVHITDIWNVHWQADNIYVVRLIEWYNMQL